MRKKCIVCGAPLLERPLYVCKNMPSASQDLPTKDNLEQDKPMDYDFCQCSGCGLVQFNCEPVTYYKDSTRAGERSAVLIQARREQYKHLIETYHLQGKKILEIGAGKGGFLKTLKEMREYEVQEYGIENNGDFARIAREEEGVNVQQGDPESAETGINGGPFDAFVSFAYPARLVDPNAMMQLAGKHLKEGGIGLVVVPSLEHLMKPGGFYDITRDHIAYYNAETLAFLLQKNGFQVLEQGSVAQIYIYAIVKKREAIDLETCWADVGPLAEELKQFAKQATQNGKKLAVWCAGHFAFTALCTSGIGSSIEYIIDNAKFKQGRYSPGSHVPIVGAEYYEQQPVQTILVLGPLFEDEIVKEIRERFGEDISVATMNKSGLHYIT